MQDLGNLGDPLTKSMLKTCIRGSETGPQPGAGVHFSGSVNDLAVELLQVGHRGRGDWSGSSEGSASALMPTYKEWVIKGEASGADPRGDLKKQQTIDQPGRQVHAKQRTIGFQGRFASKNFRHRCPKTNLIAPLRTRWACVQMFNISEKNHMVLRPVVM